MPVENAPAQRYPFPSGYVDIDLPSTAQEKTIIDLSRREHEADYVN